VLRTKVRAHQTRPDVGQTEREARADKSTGESRETIDLSPQIYDRYDELRPTFSKDRRAGVTSSNACVFAVANGSRLHERQVRCGLSVSVESGRMVRSPPGLGTIACDP